MKKYVQLIPRGTLLVAVALLAFCASSCMPPPEGESDVVVQNYVPPPWAPPYDNVSAVRYYYLPDYDVYYDVWDGNFWYEGPDGWISTVAPPPQCAGVDLRASFVVLIDRNIDRPWQNHAYYRDNYPAHGYDQYKDIVVHNRIVTNTAPGHELVPRAFNENNNRVTFMQRPVVPDRPAPPPPPMHDHPMPEHPPAPPQPISAYHHVVHEVPMSKITPSMPPESQNRNYGGGYSKARAPQPQPARSEPAHGPENGGSKR